MVVFLTLELNFIFQDGDGRITLEDLKSVANKYVVTDAGLP